MVARQKILVMYVSASCTFINILVPVFKTSLTNLTFLFPLNKIQLYDKEGSHTAEQL